MGDIIKKINIIQKNEEYNDIIKNSKKIINKDIIVFYTYNNDVNYSFGFSVSKKLGNAVLRNKIKRQIKNILSKKNYKKGFKCIIMVKRAFLFLSFIEKEKTIFDLLNKLDIIEVEK